MSGAMLYSYYEGVVAKPDQQPSHRSMGNNEATQQQQYDKQRSATTKVNGI